MPAKQLWLRSDAIWRSDSESFAPGWVIVEGEIFAGIAGPGDQPPAGAELRDLGALRLLPGLINTHVHLEFSAGLTAMRDFYAETEAERLLRALHNAQVLLMSGVTTARDCGSGWAMLALARRPDLLPAALPRLVLSGPPMTRTGPAGHLHFMDGVVESHDDIRLHVARLKAQGGRSVKVMASGGGMTPGSDMARTMFAQEDLNLMTELAREHGYPSVSHVLGRDSMRLSALARFDSLEHCAFHVRRQDGGIERQYDDDLAMLIRDSGAHVMANLSTSTNSFERRKAEGDALNGGTFGLDQFAVARENFMRMVQLGIPMTMGSDAGVSETPFDESWKEIMWMMRAGLSGAGAIRAATTGAAAALKMQGSIGRIAPGYSADLVAIDADPLADEAAFARPALVMARGVIHLDTARPQA